MVEQLKNRLAAALRNVDLRIVELHADELRQLLDASAANELAQAELATLRRGYAYSDDVEGVYAWAMLLRQESECEVPAILAREVLRLRKQLKEAARG